MTYQEFQEMTVSKKLEFMNNSVKFIVTNLNRLRLCYDATPYTIEEKINSFTGKNHLEIKCPYETLAWKLAVILEASTIMSISVDGKKVYVD